ncbi:hypothetical protein SAMN06265355_1175 [Actinomadura mexicana]|uniref:Uncharacterized protein n=1 Tax=Actinomadura mexicana TaxID=134959 RepID=A0A239EBS5_9ACTN|nr:hypothetical protein SAMN06265355_1175 [Actinomadura mexicana]
MTAPETPVKTDLPAEPGPDEGEALVRGPGREW